MNSPKLSSPSMDITVIRNGRNVCGVGIDKSQDSMLLKRRIEIPFMNHVDLDNQKDMEQNSLFYPDGKKNLVMTRTISNTFKDAINFDVRKFPTNKGHKYRSPHKKGLTREREPLIYSNSKGRESPEIRKLINRSRFLEGSVARDLHDWENTLISEAKNST